MDQQQRFSSLASIKSVSSSESDESWTLLNDSNDEHEEFDDDVVLEGTRANSAVTAATLPMESVNLSCGESDAFVTFDTLACNSLPAKTSDAPDVGLTANCSLVESDAVKDKGSAHQSRKGSFDSNDSFMEFVENFVNEANETSVSSEVNNESNNEVAEVVAALPAASDDVSDLHSQIRQLISMYFANHVPQVNVEADNDIMAGDAQNFHQGFSDDLPVNFVEMCSNRMRNYIHHYNSPLNWKLTLLVALATACCLGVGIGNFVGQSLSCRKTVLMQAESTKTLQGNLITCLRELDYIKKYHVEHLQKHNAGLKETDKSEQAQPASVAVSLTSKRSESDNVSNTVNSLSDRSSVEQPAGNYNIAVSSAVSKAGSEPNNKDAALNLFTMKDHISDKLMKTTVEKPRELSNKLRLELEAQKRRESIEREKLLMQMRKYSAELQRLSHDELELKTIVAQLQQNINDLREEIRLERLSREQKAVPIDAAPKNGNEESDTIISTSDNIGAGEKEEKQQRASKVNNNNTQESASKMNADLNKFLNDFLNHTSTRLTAAVVTWSSLLKNLSLLDTAPNSVDRILSNMSPLLNRHPLKRLWSFYGNVKQKVVQHVRQMKNEGEAFSKLSKAWWADVFLFGDGVEEAEEETSTTPESRYSERPRDRMFRSLIQGSLWESTVPLSEVRMDFKEEWEEYQEDVEEPVFDVMDTIKAKFDRMFSDPSEERPLLSDNKKPFKTAADWLQSKVNPIVSFFNQNTQESDFDHVTPVPSPEVKPTVERTHSPLVDKPSIVCTEKSFDKRHKIVPSKPVQDRIAAPTVDKPVFQHQERTVRSSASRRNRLNAVFNEEAPHVSRYRDPASTEPDPYRDAFCHVKQPPVVKNNAERMQYNNKRADADIRRPNKNANHNNNVLRATAFHFNTEMSQLFELLRNGGESVRQNNHSNVLLLTYLDKLRQLSTADRINSGDMIWWRCQKTWWALMAATIRQRATFAREPREFPQMPAQCGNEIAPFQNTEMARKFLQQRRKLCRLATDWALKLYPEQGTLLKQSGCSLSNENQHQSSSSPLNSNNNTPWLLRRAKYREQARQAQAKQDATQRWIWERSMGRQQLRHRYANDENMFNKNYAYNKRQKYAAKQEHKTAKKQAAKQW